MLEPHDDDLVSRRLSRRAILGLLGGAAGSAVMLGCGSGSDATDDTTDTGSGTTTGSTTGSSGSASCVMTAETTEGPFWVDEELNRSDLTSGTSRTTVTGGTPLELKFTVHRYSASGCSVIEGAQVDVWHADAGGSYSDVSSSAQSENTSGQTFLRGYQLTDSSGAAGFTTIYPGWYQGRTAHIHVRIRVYNSSGNTTSNVATQVFFDDSISDQVYSNLPYSSRGGRTTRNSNDGIYADDLLLTLVANSAGTGYVGTFVIGVVTD